MLKRIINIHPMITGGLIVASFDTYFHNGLLWCRNSLEEKPLPLKEYLKKNFPDLAYNGIMYFIIGSSLGSVAKKVTHTRPIQNILTASLSISFYVILRTIDIMI